MNEPNGIHTHLVAVTLREENALLCQNLLKPVFSVIYTVCEPFRWSSYTWRQLV